MSLTTHEKGQVQILLGLGLMTVLGGTLALVCDTGLAYLERARMQNAVDAATLAGGQLLCGDWGSARREAADYFITNKQVAVEQTVEAARLDTSHYYTTEGRLTVHTFMRDGTPAIEVSSNSTVELLFGRLLGFETVVASAQARALPATGVDGGGKAQGLLMPWILTLAGDPNDPADDLGDGKNLSSLTTGAVCRLKMGSQASSRGNFGALALGGHGAATYRDNIIHGANLKLKTGDRLSTEPGNMVGPTRQGLDTRMRDHSRRTVAVPVTRDPLPGGRGEITVDGIAAVWLEAYEERAHDIQLWARYLGPQMWGEFDGTLAASSQQGNVRAVVLVD